jgi:membrane associated rhomboid family serine protease
MNPASPYVIAIIVAIIVGSYGIGLWRKMSFTATTVIANMAIFIVYIGPNNYEIFRDVVETLGFTNTSLQTGENIWGIFTHMYIHANFPHVLFNMLIFYLMGIHFEERVGWRYMALVYFGTGVLGAGVLNGLVTLPGGTVIGVGASGAISGVIGAFAIMYPRDRVPMVLGFILLPRVQVAFGALVFILFQTFLMIFSVSLPGMGNVSYTAHLMGAAAGVGIGFTLMRVEIQPPTTSSKLGRRLDKMDLEMLRPLVRNPVHTEKLEAIMAEDIPEVREVLLEDLVSRLRCPDCASILTQKGSAIRCEGCDYRLDLRKGRSG